MVRPWKCPACGRRVPAYIETCHCGVARAEAGEPGRGAGATPRPAARGFTLEGLPARLRALELPWEVWTALGLAALMLLAGVAWLALGPPRSNGIVPVLGYANPTPPPTPKPTLFKRSR